MSTKSRHSDDERIVELLASGHSQTATAQQVGVSLSTVRRRLVDESFRARIEEFRAQMLTAGAGRLAASIDKAVATLAELMESGTPSIQLGAARCVLEASVRFREIVSLEARIEALENRK